ncbi:MAG: hypothetical protein ACTSO9_04775 [Candidatus Helarchaeota archaeon]
MVEITLSISEDSHEKLMELSEFYDKEIGEILNEIIEAVCFQSGWITQLSEEYKVPINLLNVVWHLLEAGIRSTNIIENNILERLDAKGLFIQDDVIIDLDEGYTWIHFAALRGSKLYIESFDVTITALVRLTASHLVDMEKIDDTSLSRMYEITENIPRSKEITLPESFLDLMEVGLDIIEEDEYLELTIDITEEAFHYLPSIFDISELFKQILQNAGVNHEINNIL